MRFRSWCNNPEDHRREGQNDFERRGRPDQEKYRNSLDACDDEYTRGFDEARRNQEREEMRREEEEQERRAQERRAEERRDREYLEEQARQHEEEVAAQQAEYEDQMQQAIDSEVRAMSKGEDPGPEMSEVPF